MYRVYNNKPVGASKARDFSGLLRRLMIIICVVSLESLLIFLCWINVWIRPQVRHNFHFGRQTQFNIKAAIPKYRP